MKAYLINMHLLVPRSSSSAKVKVKYKGYISQKMAFSGAFVFHKHILGFFFAVELEEPKLACEVKGNFADIKKNVVPVIWFSPGRFREYSW